MRKWRPAIGYLGLACLMLSGCTANKTIEVKGSAPNLYSTELGLQAAYFLAPGQSLDITLSSMASGGFESAGSLKFSCQFTQLQSGTSGGIAQAAVSSQPADCSGLPGSATFDPATGHLVWDPPQVPGVFQLSLAG